MKKCNQCNQHKTEKCFHRNSKRPDGYAVQCKDCVKKYHSDWYQNNKQRVLKHSLQYRKRLLEQIKEIRENSSCYCCGEKETVCLDFHHLDNTTKDFAIADMAYKGQKWETIQKEIDKCVCVCRNCHAKIHANIITLGP